jgi:hypothetical protein
VSQYDVRSWLISDQLSAGFGYTFFHNGLRDHSKPIGHDEFSGHLTDLVQPLVHQPGEGWQYGVRGIIETFGLS